MSVGLVYSSTYLEHDTGQHPENAGRLVSVMKLLEETEVMERTVPLPLRAATTAELARVHSESYISQVESLAKIGGGWIDGDTVVSPASYDVALLAAGGLINSVDAVMTGQVDSAFALVRPPGHHATHTTGAGFCLFCQPQRACRRLRCRCRGDTGIRPAPAPSSPNRRRYGESGLPGSHLDSRTHQPASRPRGQPGCGECSASASSCG